MAIDRTGARRRVKAITAWAAAGAAALTAGFAFGASHSKHVAQSSNPAPATTSAPPQDTAPQTTQPQLPQDNGSLPQDNGGGFAPPSTSTAPPSGMSGGS